MTSNSDSTINIKQHKVVNKSYITTMNQMVQASISTEITSVKKINFVGQAEDVIQ